MISLQKVSKVYPGGVGAVEDLSLEIQAGETLVLLGTSGCGKTTTLKLINRLVEPTSGSVLIEGQDVTSLDPVLLRRKIGYVFQGIGLFPHWTVAENVAATPKLLGWPDRQIQDRVDALLNDVGLPPQDYRLRYPAELSGGQQQRVGVARALAAETRILLMDEPFGAVDPVTRDGLQEQIKTIQKRLGLTVVLVTHDVNEALLLADRLAVMDAGKILQVGTPRELSTQAASPQVTSLLAMPRRQSERLQSIIGDGLRAEGRNEEQ
jgi:osmoprotectant transport system ATP-binding protein